jgi:hypothetical protein
MSLDQKAITNQPLLLAYYRAVLARLLRQAAQFGGEVLAPPGMVIASDVSRVQRAMR